MSRHEVWRCGKGREGVGKESGSVWLELGCQDLQGAVNALQGVGGEPGSS